MAPGTARRPAVPAGAAAPAAVDLGTQPQATPQPRDRPEFNRQPFPRRPSSVRRSARSTTSHGCVRCSTPGWWPTSRWWMRVCPTPCPAPTPRGATACCCTAPARRGSSLLAAGAPACVTVTFLDRLDAGAVGVPFRHGLSLGHALRHRDGADRRGEERRIRGPTEHLLPGRWGHIRGIPLPKEDKATLLVHLRPQRWSLKAADGFAGGRAGGSARLRPRLGGPDRPAHRRRTSHARSVAAAAEVPLPGTRCPNARLVRNPLQLGA